VFGWGMAATALAVSVLSGGAARAEDYCNLEKVAPDVNVMGEVVEKKIREKCKVGDIIFAANADQIGRLCELRQPIVHANSWGAVCFLAPPRKTY